MDVLKSNDDQRSKERRSKIVPKLTPLDKARVQNIEGEGGRVYAARGIGGVEYAGPSPKCLPSPPLSDDKVPAFVDGEGIFYNKFYEELDAAALQANGVDLSDPAFTFPKPEAFLAQEDYDGALMQWKVELSKALGRVKLPTVLGSVFYRPAVGTSGIQSDLELSESTTMSEEDHSESGEPKSARGSPSMHPATPGQSEGTEGDMDDSDLFDRRWRLERDPWAASLVAAEPDPQRYSSYEEYERAMHNWGRVCAKSAMVPPSAEQMERLLGLTLQEEGEDEDPGLRVSTVLLSHGVDDTQEESSFMPRTDLLWVSETDDELYSGFTLKRPKCVLPQFDVLESAEAMHGQGGNSVRQSRKLGNMDRTFTNLLKQRIANLKGPFHQYHAPDVGRTHFVVGMEKPALGGRRDSSISSPVRRGSRAKSTPEKSSQEPLRRLDLKFQEVVAHSDIPQRMEGTCAFYPQTQIDHVDLKLLHSRSGRNRIREIMNEIQYSMIQDPLYSWYNPLTKKKGLEAMREKARSYLFAGTGPLTINELMEVFSCGAYLDELDEFLSEEVAGHSEETSYLKELMKSVSTDSFARLLSVSSYSNTRLVHASVSQFVTQVIQQGKLGKQIVAHVVDTRDFPTLYRLATSFNLLHHSQTEIWPYNETLIASACMKMNKTEKDICMTILLMHYLDCICSRMSDNAYMFVSVLEYAKAVRTAEAVELASTLATDLGFVSTTIFSLVDHRVRKISTFGLFLMVQLLGFSDIPDIVSSIQAEETDFLNQVRKLAKSKKLHAQSAARRLYMFMQTNATWGPFLYGFYNRYELAVIDDLQATQVDGSPSVLSGMALKLCLLALEQVSRLRDEAAAKQLSRIGFVMKGSNNCLFHHLLQLVRKDRGVNRKTTYNICVVLSSIAKEFRKRDMIAGGEGAQRPHSVGRLLPVSAHDVMQLVEWAATMKSDTVERREAKAHLLSTARSLCMAPLPFSSMKKELNFYLHLLQLCREGESPAANKEAWKLMYTLIRHHAGVVPWMEANHKLLNQLLEIVSIGASMTVVRNSLYYIAKILELVQSESAAVFNGRQNHRGDMELKTYEKEVKIINSFIVAQSKWIKFHMIYKKLAGEGFAGQAFLALVKLFTTIDKNKGHKQTGGEKLYKEISKTPEYVEGIDVVIGMSKKPTVDPAHRPISRSLSISRVNSVKKV
eukprot:TRINITY_DN2735_c0_g3_i1.p1 TRINITY_DN2735_c0_g3~~TRINITY_DN2735_c0_g3_i1.p1  ORF type:complete len:1185 (-),score=349.46 TRINITY_DN2735_c0_g3_i1:215-3769(-)